MNQERPASERLEDYRRRRAEAHALRRRWAWSLYPDLIAHHHDPRPGLVEREARDWCEGVGSAIWTPSSATGAADHDPSVNLAVVGALWVSAWMGVETCWTGETLRGPPDLLARLAALECESLSKDAIRLRHDDLRSRGGLLVDPGAAKLGLWAGQVNAAHIWTHCAKEVALGATELDTPVYSGASGTGYDETAVADALRDGFSGTVHNSLILGVRSAREILSLLGAGYVAHRWRAQALGRGCLNLPRLTGVALRDLSDLRRLMAAAIEHDHDLAAAYRIDFLGPSRRVARYSLIGGAPMRLRQGSSTPRRSAGAQLAKLEARVDKAWRIRNIAPSQRASQLVAKLRSETATGAA